jgi:hypothetical protein
MDDKLAVEERLYTGRLPSTALIVALCPGMCECLVLAPAPPPSVPISSTVFSELTLGRWLIGLRPPALAYAEVGMMMPLRLAPARENLGATLFVKPIGGRFRVDTRFSRVSTGSSFLTPKKDDRKLGVDERREGVEGEERRLAGDAEREEGGTWMAGGTGRHWGYCEGGMGKPYWPCGELGD